MNVEELLQQVYRETMVDVTAGEKKQFYNTYIKPMRIVIDAEGNASIRLGGDWQRTVWKWKQRPNGSDAVFLSYDL